MRWTTALWCFALLSSAIVTAAADAAMTHDLPEGWEWRVSEGLVVDGRRLAMMGHRLATDPSAEEVDGAAVILQIRDGRQVQTRFESKAVPLRFSPDGGQLVALQFDPSIRRCENCPQATVLIGAEGQLLWRSAYGRRIKRRFSPDGRFLYAAEQSRTIGGPRGDAIEWLDLQDWSEQRVELSLYRSAWMLAGGTDLLVVDPEGIRRVRLGPDGPSTVWSFSDPIFSRKPERGSDYWRSSFRPTRDGGLLIVAPLRGYALVVDTDGVVRFRYDWREAATSRPYIPSDRFYWAQLDWAANGQPWLDAQCQQWLLDLETGGWHEAQIDPQWAPYRRSDGIGPSLAGNQLTLRPLKRVGDQQESQPCPRRHGTAETDALLQAWQQSQAN